MSGICYVPKNSGSDVMWCSPDVCASSIINNTVKAVPVGYAHARTEFRDMVELPITDPAFFEAISHVAVEGIKTFVGWAERPPIGGKPYGFILLPSCPSMSVLSVSLSDQGFSQDVIEGFYRRIESVFVKVLEKNLSGVVLSHRHYSLGDDVDDLKVCEEVEDVD